MLASQTALYPVRPQCWIWILPSERYLNLSTCFQFTGLSYSHFLIEPDFIAGLSHFPFFFFPLALSKLSCFAVRTGFIKPITIKSLSHLEPSSSFYWIGNKSAFYGMVRTTYRNTWRVSIYFSEDFKLSEAIYVTVSSQWDLSGNDMYHLWAKACYCQYTTHSFLLPLRKAMCS